jgi:NADH-quinone oxidoreductase subunit G
MAEIYINEQPHTVDDGQMIIEVADNLGYDIPRFCYHRKLSVAANCRMCMVEVEKMRKPVPACATPISDGMRIYTNTEGAVAAREGVMEFLLINHPLDCPICDQGGECDLQDLAMAHGGSHSRFNEAKRAVTDPDLGPLIATDMTRCIHCTRCVRFGEEIGGVKELGATFRGEEMAIGTYVSRAVESEMSGNMIDLCPVGALTSKPYRFKARSWEMNDTDGVCPHCSVGCNTRVEHVQGEAKRVLPRTNEAVNEEWLCDKGRFGYEGTYHGRVEVPMIKRDGEWQEVPWSTAFDAVSEALKPCGSRLGVLVDPAATLEEMWLTQRVARALGAKDIDHRTHLADAGLDAKVADSQPLLGTSLAGLEDHDAVLVVGGFPRQEQPLINHRLHKIHKAGGAVAYLNPVAYRHNYRPAAEAVYGAGRDAAALAAVTAALGGQSADFAAAGVDAEAAQRLVTTLQGAERPLVLLGNGLQEHPQAGDLLALGHRLAEAAGAGVGYLAGHANSVGAWTVGCVPHRGPADEPQAKTGAAAPAFLGEGRDAYLVVQADPLVEAADPAAAQQAFADSGFRVVVSSHWTATADAADVVLPAAAYPENEGSLISAEGRVQHFDAAVPAPGEARPAWKILRVLGDRLGLRDMTFADIGELRARVKQTVGEAGLEVGQAPAAVAGMPEVQPAAEAASLWRVPTRHIYHDDVVSRFSPALQEAFGGAFAALHPDTAAAHGLSEHAEAGFRGSGGKVFLPVVLDTGVPQGTVWIPAGEATADLGPTFGPVELAS